MDPKTRSARWQHCYRRTAPSPAWISLLLFFCRRSRFFSCHLVGFFAFLSHPSLSFAGTYYTYVSWLGFVCLKAGFQAFIVMAVQKRSWAISVMPLLLQPNNCRTYCNCVAGIRVYLRSSVLLDFCSVTGIQITVSSLQGRLFCWRSLRCQGSILSLLGA